MKLWETKNGLKIYRILSGRCNSFLIFNGQNYLLVDTGRKNRWNALKSRLDEIGVSKGSLVALILTHAHFDHAENAYRIRKNYSTKLIIHEKDGEYIKNGDNPPIMGTNPITGFLTGLAGKRLYEFAKYDPVDFDITVQDSYNLAELGFNSYIIHTPGHTEGSVSVIVDEEVAIVGDAMFGIFPNSVFPPFAGDARCMVKSWEKLLETNCKVFLPAHGTEDSRELLEKDYEKYMDKFGL